MKRYANVNFSGSTHSCLATVSWPLTPSRSRNVTVIKIEDNKGRNHYASVVSTFQSDTPTIRLNGKFGKLLGLTNGEMVAVSEVTSDVPCVKRAHVHCESEEDWEILEPNAESMTSNLLNQLRVVYPGLKFPFWVSKSLTVNLCVDSVEPPLEFGILETYTEIVVPSASVSSEEMYQLEGTVRFRVQPVVVPRKKEGSNSLSANVELLLKNTSHGFVFRSDLERQLSSNYCEGVKDMDCSFFYAKIIPDGREAEPESQVVLKIFFIESVVKTERDLENVFPHANPSRLFMHHKLVDKLRLCKSTVSVVQVSGTAPLAEVESIYTSPRFLQPECIHSSRSFSQIYSKARLFLSASLNLHGSVPRKSEWGWLLITGKPGSGKTTFASRLCKDLADFPYFVHYELVQCAKLRGKKSETVQKELEAVMKHGSAYSPSVIVLDDLDVICPSSKGEQQSAQEDFLHYRMCDTIYECMMAFAKYQLAVICTARTPSSLHEYWKAREGFHLFQHSIHIPPPNPLERLDIFRTCLRRYQCAAETTRESSSTILPSTTTTISSAATILPPTFLSGTADNTAPAAELDNGDAPSLTTTLEDIHMTPVMSSALFNLHDDEATPKTIHNIAKKWALICASSGFSSLSPDEKNAKFLSTIEMEMEFSDQHSKRPGKTVKWQDIGGLSKVKSELTKILQWPIKYAKLFDEAPIKMPSGILLYGYPGTGKTLVGLAMPSLVSNAKFIHIKGPELLSKYIGASEQAVQDLFRKAKEMSPCILFFDEFDSLVPRRGHDSTGVTDRVVNQFLAEMDGIEGGLGKGVYLVAATSRPDLIDPAVLRPGRLDRHLFFPLPDEGERLEIISALGKDLVYSTQADDEDGGDEILWDEIGRETEGFTGADLHSLLCTAQLEAIQEALSEVLGSDGDMIGVENQDLSSFDAGKIIVGRRHMAKALENFKPSLPAEELIKFRMIYENFSPVGKSQQQKKRRSGNSDDNNSLMEPGKKATLA